MYILLTASEYTKLVLPSYLIWIKFRKEKKNNLVAQSFQAQTKLSTYRLFFFPGRQIKENIFLPDPGVPYKR